MSKSLVIIGAGGHAKALADALLSGGRTVLGFTDPDPAKQGMTFLGLSVLGSDDVLSRFKPWEIDLVNGQGGVRTGGLRRHVQESLEKGGWHFASVTHPAAVVSRFARLASGVQLLAACVVQAGAEIGRGCIVNTGAIVEHDVSLGEFVHVATGAKLCGDVRVGAHSHLGAGCVVRQGVCLGERTLVGAGAAVVKNFAGGGTLIGVPAVTMSEQQ